MNKHFSKITLIFPVLMLAVGLTAGCGTTATTETAKNSNTAVITNSAAANSNAPATSDPAKAFGVDFKSEPGTITAGTPAVLSFTVKDRNGAIVKDLPVVHEKPMHLLIVSKDLAEFYHVHPEQSADGSYKVTHSFPNGGDYKLYADFTPKGAAQVVEQIDVNVAGTPRAAVPLAPDQKLEKSVDGLRVVMKPDGEIRAGRELMLNFQMFDAKTGKPATDLENYLGELAHFVIISEDMKDFVHAHPMSKGEHDESGGNHDNMKMDAPAKADNHAADGHSHSTMEGVTTKPGTSKVAAHTAFPRTGLYRVWAQFQRGGNVITVPFTVRVGEAGKTAAAVNQNPEVPAGATKITISKNGYEPSSVSVRKGEKVALAFTRTDAENCGGEVVFQKLKIRRKLPVGETVLIDLTPTDAGELAFTCGMGMYKGKMLVAAN